MVTIHHESFPHIIDCIWRELDFLDLQVARLVCKDWARRVDTLLWHISVEHQPDGRLHVRTLGDCKSVYFHTVPFTAPAPGNVWMRLTSKVQVLDLVGAEKFSQHQDLSWLRPFIQRIPLVRWHGTPPRPIDALNMDTLLFFQDLIGSTAPVVTLRYTQFQPQSVISTLRCTIDPLCLRLSGRDDAVNFYGWDGCTDEVTLILQDARPEPRQPPPSGEDKKIDVIMAYLNIVRVESAYIRIVGLEAFLPDSEWPAFRERVAQQFRAENDESGEPWSDEDEEFSTYWKFLTHEQYREEVGDVRYKLYTVR